MTVLLTNKRERTRFLRFAAVGVMGALVDFGTMNALVGLLGFQLVVAGTISFICAVVNNYLWNRYWIYPDSRKKHALRQLGEFSVVSVMGLAIRVPILKVGEPLLLRLIGVLPFRFPILGSDFLAKNITLAFAVIIVMFWNFFINRYWTYGDVE
jgi:putative flippase GtrA